MKHQKYAINLFHVGMKGHANVTQIPLQVYAHTQNFSEVNCYVIKKDAARIGKKIQCV